MKKTILFLVLVLGISGLSYGQITKSNEHKAALRKEVKMLIKEVSEKIVISDYQQKITTDFLVEIRDDYRTIENSNQGDSQKTIAFNSLELRKELGLKNILNTQQYEMLVAFIDDQKEKE